MWNGLISSSLLVQSVSCRVVEVRFVILDGLNLCTQNVIMQRYEVRRLCSQQRRERRTLWRHTFASKWTHLTNVFGLEEDLMVFSLFFSSFCSTLKDLLFQRDGSFVKTMTFFFFFFYLEESKVAGIVAQISYLMYSQTVDSYILSSFFFFF